MRIGLPAMRSTLGLVAALIVLLASGVLAPAAGAKGKVCKGKTVAVKVGKRTTCRPFAKLFPPPSSKDIRLAYLEQAIRFNPSKYARLKKTKKGRAARAALGSAPKRAQRKLLALAPKLLAFLDKKGGARRSSFGPGPALASVGCQAGPAGPTGSTGGASIGALGDNGGYIDAPIGGGLRIKITFVSCGGVGSFNLPQCPKADGSVDSSGSGEFRATFEIRDGNQVLSRNSSVFEEKAKAHGEVGADAKLKFIDLEHTQEVFIVASVAGSYPVVVRGGLKRKLRIQMPGGSYNPESATVTQIGPDPVGADTAAASFASTAKAAVSSYREREPRWSTFQEPYCAEPVFSPAADAIKVKKGDQKSVSIYAKASDGGRATAAKWTLEGALNAEFSPTSTDCASPSISYTVSKKPAGNKIMVTAKFTSTAGVGKKTWTEPIEPDEINHITGTFTVTSNANGSIEEWSGDATYERLHPRAERSDGRLHARLGDGHGESLGLLGRRRQHLHLEWDQDLSD